MDTLLQQLVVTHIDIDRLEMDFHIRSEDLVSSGKVLRVGLTFGPDNSVVRHLCVSVEHEIRLRFMAKCPRLLGKNIITFRLCLEEATESNDC
jgi:hypothetical protein